jgi:hypothetical protein
MIAVMLLLLLLLSWSVELLLLPLRAFLRPAFSSYVHLYVLADWSTTSLS